MIQIIHNPRCSKSREGLTYLNENNIEYQIIAYLDNPLTQEEIKDVLKKLNISPIDLIRKNEAIWKEKYKNATLTDEEIVEAMVQHPKLIERPIFINDDRAVIGRPTERITEIL
ncbi:MAG TPA: arsenate reductase (glutaredoxin) [Flavobacterium sp.]|nr:arsenate reductase (glutaredoxin) [Flavobacterium sp.]